MSDALGVGAFLVSSDEQVVLMKRGEHLAEAPGLWDIPGGHPEPQVRSVLCPWTTRGEISLHPSG